MVRFNLVGGLAIDILTHETGALQLARSNGIGLDEPYCRILSSEWSRALHLALASIEAFDI
jgi:predicted proteasome-type protease